jgi:hypothetical protein
MLLARNMIYCWANLRSLVAQCPRDQLSDSLQDFIHNNFFLGRGTSEMCHLFKISTIGRGSNVDYVCHMFKGDLTHYWVFLHHIKRLKNWTMISINVYDHFY